VETVPLPGGLPGAAVAGPSDARADAVDALMALGYARAEASQAIDKAAREAGDELRLETLVRLSLKHLFRG